MGARYYDPIVGRFMGIDPVGFKETNPISFNRYAYANNNPYKFVDPDGRESNPVSGGDGISNNQLRTNSTNPRVGMFGDSRSKNNWNGGFHNGVDIYAKVGTPLVAPISGKATVIDAKNNPKGGNVLLIETDRDGHTIKIGMAHLSKIDVKSGDSVKEGQPVGMSGATGNAQGVPVSEEHVHLTVRVDGNLKDPQAHFRDNPSHNEWGK
jgi:murein DD-endopeptidase MepM/ murein hydrolase activator NlpD